MSADVILVIVVATALVFDFTNGFHDTANVVATAISTRAIAPKPAVAMAAVLNFVGAFLSLKVATTVAKGFVNTEATKAVAVDGREPLRGDHRPNEQPDRPGGNRAADRVRGRGYRDRARVPDRGEAAPRSCGPRVSPRSARLQRLLSLSHGTNDAQKTMGVIALALVANGDPPAKGFHVPTWVVIASATAIALGTFVGGWRIIKTLGARIIKMDVAQGFAAQAAGASVILAASGAGYPLSTTHVISGAIVGSGAAKRISAVRWGVAGNIVTAWALTLPAAAVMGGAVYAASELFGKGVIGPLVITLALLLGLAAAFIRRLHQASPAPVAP